MNSGLYYFGVPLGANILLKFFGLTHNKHIYPAAHLEKNLRSSFIAFGYLPFISLANPFLSKCSEYTWQSYVTLLKFWINLAIIGVPFMKRLKNFITILGNLFNRGYVQHV